jgi:hypothetical protein
MTRRNGLRVAMHALRRNLRRTLKQARRGASAQPGERYIASDSRVNLRVSDNVAHDGAVTAGSAEQTTALHQHNATGAAQSASDNARNRMLP